MKASILYKALILFIFLCISMGNLCAQTVSITTNPNPPTICAGDTITLTANPSGFTVGTSYNYSWSPDNDTTASIIKSPNDTITYSVTVTESGQTANVSQIVNVDQLSMGGLVEGGVTPICQGSSTGTMTLSGHVGSVIKWQKSLNSGSWTDISNITKTYSEIPSSAGSWQYRAVVQNGNCTSATSVIKSIEVKVDPDDSDAGPDQTDSSTCGLTQVNLAANNPSNGKGMWSVDSGTGGSFANASMYNTKFMGVQGTTYILKWTISNNPCTASSDTVQVSFNKLPDISISAKSETTFCDGKTVMLEAGQKTYKEYQWKKDGNIITGANSTSYIASESGKYTLEVSDDIPCYNTSSEIMVTVNPKPETPVVSVDCKLGVGKAKVEVVSPIGSGYEYKLDMGGYQSSASFSDVNNGGHSVTVKNAMGCESENLSFDVQCDCKDNPTLKLISEADNVCGITIKPITGSFGGSATEVTVSHNGKGTLNQMKFTSTPFTVEYSPNNLDLDKEITVSFATDNPLGPPCEPATKTFLLKVNSFPAPTISSFSLSAMCSGQSRQLSGSPSGGYLELISGKGVINGNILKTNEPGVIQIKYCYTNSNKCTACVVSKIQVNPSPTVQITSSNSDLCVNETRKLEASPPGGTFTLIGPGKINNNEFTSTSDGDITLIYTFVNEDKCVGSDTQFVKVNPLPDVSISGVPLEMCFNEVLPITILPQGGTLNCQGCEVNNLELKPLSTGNIKLTYEFTDPATNCKNTTFKDMLAKPVPIADFLAKEHKDNKLKYDFKDTSKATTSSNLTSWNYDFEDIDIIDLKSTTPPLVFTRNLKSGENKLNLTVVDENTCKNVSNRKIFVQSKGCGFTLTNLNDTLCFGVNNKFITKINIDSLETGENFSVQLKLKDKILKIGENLTKTQLANLEIKINSDSLVFGSNEIVFNIIPFDAFGNKTSCDTIKFPFYLKVYPNPEIILDNSEDVTLNSSVLTFCKKSSDQEFSIFDKGNNFGYDENYKWTFENQTFSSSSINISSNSDKAPKTVTLTKTNAPGCVSDTSIQVRFYDYPTITLDTLPCLPYIQIKGLKNEDKIESINAGKLVPETPFIDITGVQAKTLVLLASNDFCSDTANLALKGGDNFATIDVNKFQTYTCNGISNFIYPVPGLCYEWGEINDQGVVTFPILSLEENQQFIPVKAGSKYFVRVYECGKKDCGKVTEPRSLDEELIDDVCLAKKDITIKLFPNPNTGDFTLHLIDGEKGAYHIRIFDVLGRILFDQWYEHDGKNVAIPFLLHPLNQSFYTMNIQSPKGKVMNLPFIKIR